MTSQNPGRHGTAYWNARKKVLANASFILPVHDRPAKVEHGVVVARLQDSVPGPITQTLPKRNWFPA